MFGNSLEISGAGDLTEFPARSETSKTILPSEVVDFEFAWWGLSVCLRFELHTEYFTMSSFIGLSERAGNTHAADVSAPSEVTGIISAFTSLAQKIGKDLNANNFTGEYKDIYESAWRAFERDVLAVSSDLQLGLGEVFADFRSLVIGRSYSKKDGPPAPENFYAPFWRQNNEPTPEENLVLENEQWQDVRRKFWPFITTTYNGMDFAEEEFEVTQLLGGRALYASALGAQPAEPSATSRMPVFFLLYANTLNGWQIGRVVHMLHHLGTVRLAALINFDLLRSAGYDLRGIENDIDKAANAYHFPPEVSTGTPAEEVAAQARRDHLISAILLIETALKTLNASFDGDIEYRIARSRYYIRQFRESISFLRLKRLQGYQRYDKFIERRLGSAFNFIDILGEQYERVSSDKAALFQYYLVQLQNCTEVATQNRNSKLVGLQRTAELALVFALLPYYLASTLGHMFGVPEGGSPFGQALWVTIFAIFAIEALRRARRFQEEDRETADSKKTVKPDQSRSWPWRLAQGTVMVLLVVWVFAETGFGNVVRASISNLFLGVSHAADYPHRESQTQTKSRTQP